MLEGQENLSSWYLERAAMWTLNERRALPSLGGEISTKFLPLGVEASCCNPLDSALSHLAVIPQILEGDKV